MSRLLPVVFALVACGVAPEPKGDDTGVPDPGDAPVVDPGDPPADASLPPSLTRLTRSQYRNALRDLFAKLDKDEFGQHEISQLGRLFALILLIEVFSLVGNYY